MAGEVEEVGAASANLSCGDEWRRVPRRVESRPPRPAKAIEKAQRDINIAIITATW
jgi:hypothetical protein